MSGEVVVLVDAAGRAVGTAPKHQVHHAGTPLHLAFSLYLFTDEDELLLTRRADTKSTFPGTWTNSVCGHPAPGERMADAARRRARDELGIEFSQLRLVLPRFAYRAEMGGVVENELCPVYVARVDRGVDLAPDPREVGQTAWVAWHRIADGVGRGERRLSPWSIEQVQALTALGPAPGTWRSGDPDLLPPAALG